jgi:adenylosuccinate lyase
LPYRRRSQIERYTRPQMGRIWELENKYRCWLDVELAPAAPCTAWT